MSKKIFIFAGEMSGDLHGEKLITELLSQDPSLTIVGVGGPRMRQAGMQCLLPMETFQVMGFIDILCALPKILYHFFFLRKAILNMNPEVALFIDYAEFNLLMESTLRKKGYRGKLIHYISPSVWAWRKNRIHQMARSLDLLLVIFPFEKKCFSHVPLRVDFVGHPLIERLQNYAYQENFLPSPLPVIALFPGSRKKELQRNFPFLLRMVRSLPPCILAISCCDPAFKPLLEKILKKENFDREIAFVPSEQTYDLMKRADIAIAKSGTVTLELALHEVPTVVIYKVTWIDRIIALHLFKIKLPHYSIVNIIAEKEVFPEFIEARLDEKVLIEAIQRRLFSPAFQQQCREGCRKVKQLLQDKRAKVEAAKEILSLLT
jgi:lipid-A-disaccharide synthase